MDSKISEIKKLCEALGWYDLGPQKHDAMVSFKEEETGRRCNIYPSTMTVAIQGDDMVQKYHYEVTVEELELILTT